MEKKWCFKNSVSLMLTLVVCLVLASCLHVFRHDEKRIVFLLAEDAHAAAEIVINADSDQVVKYAAEELQHWVKEISGAELPIVNRPSSMKYKIFLQVNPKRFESDLAKMKGNDGYAVRVKGNALFLFAAKPKGVLNGVYKMLFKNTDIIWARPNVEFGTIYSKNPNLALTNIDYIDIPVYVLRGWQMIGGYKHIPSQEWQVRNGNNWSVSSKSGDPRFQKYGNILEYGGGHNLIGLYITEKKYFKEHPEFFSMRDGKYPCPSKFKHRTQLCFTNPEMVKAFIKEVADKVKANPNYETYRIMIEDNYLVCQCPECLKPIKLADGTILRNKTKGKKVDKEFYSTQFFMFLNKVARHFKMNYPDKRILTFGYFFTEVPPRCNIEDNISISFCPIYKNSKATIDSPKNKETYEKFSKWMKITPELTWREYYGLTGPFPRPVDAIALADWKYVNTFGLKRTYSELYADKVGKRMNGVKSWNLNSLYFWTMTQGAWNPNQDVKALRKEFLKRVYGPAADDVEEFYRLTEKGWHDAGGSSLWDDKVRVVWLASVIEPNLTEQCRAALKRAAGKVDNEKSRKILAALTKTFEDELSKCKPVTLNVPHVSNAPKLEPDLNSGLWEKAVVTDKFYSRVGKPAKEKTVVKALYDDKNLYIGARCYHTELEKVYARPAGLSRDKWSAGEKFELFVAVYDKKGDATTSQIAVDINGNVYDAQNKDAKWNPDYDLKQQKNKDGWSVMLSIPLKDLGVDIAKKPKMKIMFIRYCDYKKKRELGFWEQGSVHNPVTFGNLILE